MVTADKSETVRQALQEAIEKATSQSALAEKLGEGIKTGHIFYWLKEGVVPERHCAVIEEAYGVSRKRLCPHWSRVWPELRKAKAQAGQGAV